MSLAFMVSINSDIISEANLKSNILQICGLLGAGGGLQRLCPQQLAAKNGGKKGGIFWRRNSEEENSDMCCLVICIAVGPCGYSYSLTTLTLVVVVR